MRKPVIALLSCLAVGFSLVACTPSIEPTIVDDATGIQEDIGSHESAPASPVAFGVSVPHGAVQLGPLVRWRSPELVKAFKVDLDAILAEEEAERIRAVEEKQLEDPEWTPPTPTPTPTSLAQSRRDSFAKLDEQPRADTFVSVMRIDGKPTPVIRSLLAQISVLLPESEIVTDDLSKYCTANNRRVVECELNVTGETPAGRTLRVHLTIDPGNVVNRTGRVASKERPVMVLYIRDIGDPRESQANRAPERLGAPPDISQTPEKSEWIWPRMDESASIEGEIIGGWTPPASATVLLTGKRPAFASMTTYRTSISHEISESFTNSLLDPESVQVDSIADLNESVISMYGTGKNGQQVRAVRIGSARGSFVSLFVLPKGW